MPSTTRTVAKDKLMRASDNIQNAMNHLYWIVEKYEGKVEAVEDFCKMVIITLDSLSQEIIKFRERFP